MIDQYRPNDLVEVPFPIDADGAPLRASDPAPREQWPWLPGLIVGKVVAHHGDGCWPARLDDGDCACPAREYVVDVIDERLLRFDDDDELGVYPVCFRTTDEIRSRVASLAVIGDAAVTS